MNERIPHKIRSKDFSFKASWQIHLANNLLVVVVIGSNKVCRKAQARFSKKLSVQNQTHLDVVDDDDDGDGYGGDFFCYLYFNRQVN